MLIQSRFHKIFKIFSRYKYTTLTSAFSVSDLQNKTFATAPELGPRCTKPRLQIQKEYSDDRLPKFKLDTVYLDSPSLLLMYFFLYLW